MNNTNTDKTIFHIDGDAFFASCEQSTNLDLRDQAIAIGKERGVATAFSYPAKRLGVTRGMNGREIRRRFGTQVQLISSDYRKYSLFSQRMKRIVREHTKNIEGSSIDECYADVSLLVHSPEESKKLAQTIQQEISTKLGLTVSIGIGPTKTIAKIASSLKKPQGITVIDQDNKDQLLYPLPIDRVPGIGYQSTPRMHGRGIQTIGDFVSLQFVYIQEQFHKPYQELHQELRGKAVRLLQDDMEPPQSISKIRAFSPATDSRDMLHSEFARNAEIVASKMYRNSMVARSMTIGVKMPADGYRSIEIKPTSPISSAQEIIQLINNHLDRLLRTNEQYRATFIALCRLQEPSKQVHLFEENKQSKNKSKKFQDITETSQRSFGKTAIVTADSLLARSRETSCDTSNQKDSSGTPLIYSDDLEKILYLPYLGLFS